MNENKVTISQLAVTVVINEQGKAKITNPHLEGAGIDIRLMQSILGKISEAQKEYNQTINK